jgi:uncharacterized membrane protein
MHPTRPGSPPLEETPILSLDHHLGEAAAIFEWLVSIIEIFAILILVLGLARFARTFLAGEGFRSDAHHRHHAINTGRIELARHIQAALEVFIVSDIIRTVLQLTLENLLILGLLVLIRTVISFVLEREMRHLERAMADGSPVTR